MSSAVLYGNTWFFRHYHNHKIDYSKYPSLFQNKSHQWEAAACSHHQQIVLLTFLASFTNSSKKVTVL
jgi:hypothetical protein